MRPRCEDGIRADLCRRDWQEQVARWCKVPVDTLADLDGLMGGGLYNTEAPDGNNSMSCGGDDGLRGGGGCGMEIEISDVCILVPLN